MNACACSRPVTDQTRLCKTCTAVLRQALAEVPSWHSRLEVTRTRQSKTGGRGIGVISRNATRPLPWDERAARAGQHLRAELVGTVRVLVEDHPGPLPQDTVTAMSRWLLQRLPQWVRHEGAAELLDGLSDALDAVRQVCDRQPDKLFLGDCGSTEAGVLCPDLLYAEVGEAWARCHTCGSQWDVKARREWQLLVVEEEVVPATMLAGLVGHLGVQLASSTVRNYAAKGRIKAVSVDADRRPLYRVGDVLDVFLKRKAG